MYLLQADAFILFVFWCGNGEKGRKYDWNLILSFKKQNRHSVERITVLSNLKLGLSCLLSELGMVWGHRLHFLTDGYNGITLHLVFSVNTNSNMNSLRLCPVWRFYREHRWRNVSHQVMKIKINFWLPYGPVYASATPEARSTLQLQRAFSRALTAAMYSFSKYFWWQRQTLVVLVYFSFA